MILGVLAGVALLGILACGGVAFLLRDRLPDEPGDTTLTVEAVTAEGTAPSRDELERTRDVLADRIAATELDRPSVDIEGGRRLVLRVDGTGHEDELRSLAGESGTCASAAYSARSRTRPRAARRRPPRTPHRFRRGTRSPTKLGPAYQLAEAITAPGSLDPATVQALAPFAALTPAEVAALPPDMQYGVPTVTCPQLRARPSGAAATGQAAACDAADPPVKYLLDVAKVSGTDIEAAEAKLGQTGEWVIAISFSGAGQQRWTDLTKEAVNAGADNQVAVMLDNLVVSAPAVLAVVTGDTEISGRFTRDQAMLLAAQIGSDPLPVALRVVG